MKKNKALRKLLKAAKMGKPYAMYELGLCYDTGERSLPMDKELAVAWIEAAAECGCHAAVAWLDDYGFDDSASVQAEA